MPVVPTTREAEVGGFPEPRSSRLQGAVIAPLHSSLGCRVRPCLKKNKNNNNKNYELWLHQNLKLIMRFTVTAKNVSMKDKLHNLKYYN